MAPAPTATANRPMVRPSKIRYFKGKAPVLAPSDEDSDNEDERVVAPEPAKIDKSLVAGGAGRIIPDGSVKKKAGLGMKMELGSVKVGETKPPALKKEAEEEEEEEESEDELDAKPKIGAPKLNGEESSEYETDSEEESEEDRKPAFRPVFVPKGARAVTQEKAAAEAEEQLRQEEEMQVQRKLDSKELAGETIRRELAEKEVIDLQPDVDDTDGLDGSAEFEEWRARELARLLRDKQVQALADEQKEEIERRRALPEEQRLREDMEFADQTRAREKGQMGFMQKYYHKGAFHQDDELLARDYTGATESAVDVSMLPKVMQVRDFGKMSRTKYTHLTDQDTSAGGWGAAARPVGAGGVGGQQQQGCFNCGGPHMRKDCPNNDINNPNGFGAGQGGAGTSANSAAFGFGGPSQRPWGGSGNSSVPDGGNGARYREEGRERRFENERRGDTQGSARGNGDDREPKPGRNRDGERRERDEDGAMESTRSHGRDRSGERYNKSDADRHRHRHRDGEKHRDHNGGHRHRERNGKSRSRSPRRERGDRDRRDRDDRDRNGSRT